MAQIALTKGYVALVDQDDLPRLQGMCWQISECKRRKPYASGSIGYGRKGARRVYMHRYLLDAPKGMQVDHINGDGLDNRRCNLRLVNGSQNNLNQPKRRIARVTSLFKGVSFDKNYPKKPWLARGYRDGKCVFRSSHTTEIEAARAYDAWSKSGSDSEFVRVNGVS